MEALKRINQEEGITVICNLHTLDTARQYCERIVGMSQGAVVFEGGPQDLTTDAARAIYGAGEEFDEASTSTSLGDDVPAGADEASEEKAAQVKVVGL